MSTHITDRLTTDFATVDSWIKANCYVTATGLRVCHITQTSREHTMGESVMVIPGRCCTMNSVYAGCLYADVMPYNYWTHECYQWGGAPKQRIVVAFDRSVQDVLNAVGSLVQSHMREAAFAIAEMKFV